MATTRRDGMLGCLVAVLTLVLAGCMTDVGGLPTYWNIENRTQSQVTVVWHRESGERIELTRLDAGQSVQLDVRTYGNSRDVCGDGEFVVTTLAGDEVMRSPMNCNPWVIEDRPGSTTSIPTRHPRAGSSSA